MRELTIFEERKLTISVILSESAAAGVPSTRGFRVLGWLA